MPALMTNNISSNTETTNYVEEWSIVRATATLEQLNKAKDAFTNIRNEFTKNSFSIAFSGEEFVAKLKIDLIKQLQSGEF